MMQLLAPSLNLNLLLLRFCQMTQQIRMRYGCSAGILFDSWDAIFYTGGVLCRSGEFQVNYYVYTMYMFFYNNKLLCICLSSPLLYLLEFATCMRWSGYSSMSFVTSQSVTVEGVLETAQIASCWGPALWCIRTDSTLQLDVITSIRTNLGMQVSKQ